METDAKKYELAYLISPRISEEDVLMYAGKITALIEDAKGLILHVEKPRMRRLGHTIAKETQAYFSWSQFTMSSEATALLDKRLKEQQFLLRHMLIRSEGSEKRLHKTASTHHMAAHSSVQQEKAMKKEEQQAEEKLDLETLDKKLEEILGK